LRDIVYVNHLSRLNETFHGAAPEGLKFLTLFQVVGERLRDAEPGFDHQALAIILEQCPELGLAKAHRVLQHRVEYRLQLAGRTADDLQDLRCGRLPLERFAQLVEQPRVVDGDDGLRGEILD
jgi:hypothetical protein